MLLTMISRHLKSLKESKVLEAITAAKEHFNESQDNVEAD